VATPPPIPGLDAESAEWLRALRSTGPDRADAVERLHRLLAGAARFEVTRRRATLGGIRGGEINDLTTQAADDALKSVLRRLDDFRGDSRFTTWADTFALLEAAAKVRRRAWRGREVPLEPETWARLAAPGPTPHQTTEQRHLLAVIHRAIDEVLTPHQREVLVALALDGVPIDVLAERLGTTRGALYTALNDARRRLRVHLAAHGLDLGEGAT